jgi:hypothetical protein
MLNIEWDQLSLKKDWTEALQQLLAEARASCLDGDINRRLACQQELATFIKLSPSDTQDLKSIAMSAVQMIYDDQLDGTIKAIDQYLLQLQGPVDQLEEIVTDVQQERSMRLTRTIEILNQASSSIDLLVKMERQMTEPNQNLILRIDAVNRSIQELFALAEELKNR